MATNIDLFKNVLAIANKYKVGTITPEVFIIWANNAQEKVVTEKLAFIDGNTRLISDILPLKVIGKTATISNGRFELDGGCKRLSHVDLSLSLNGVVNKPRVNFLPDNMKNEIFTSPYKKPSVRRCYYSFGSDTNKSYVYLHVPSGHTVTATYDYYKNPDAITMDENNGSITSVTLPWNKSMIDEIAMSIVVMYMESIGDPRYQTIKTEQLSSNNKQ